MCVTPSGNWKAALQKLEQGLLVWPDNGHLALQAANLYAKHNHVAEARQHYTRAVDANIQGTIAIQVCGRLATPDQLYPKTHPGLQVMAVTWLEQQGTLVFWLLL